ncbi:MAG: hypothetical protein U0703_23220 [Anaerolineae bacterium]
MRDMRLAARYTLVSVGIFALVYLLLFAQNSAMTLPSLTAQFNKASYQTVWALIDGNYSTGNFGAAQERLDPANASRLEGEPPVIPGVVRLDWRRRSGCSCSGARGASTSAAWSRS